MVVAHGKVHAGQHVQKVHPYRLDAFDSGEAGLVGVMEEGRIRLLAGWPDSGSDWGPLYGAIFEIQQWPRVEIIMSHAGATGALVQCLLREPPHGVLPVRGIVLAGTGNGTMHCTLEAALQTAQQQGVRVVRVSRCAYGQVVSAEAAPSHGFRSMGLPAVKARIGLMLELALAPSTPLHPNATAPQIPAQ